MKEIIDYVKARYLSEKAQGIVEYALILAFIVVVAVAVGNGGTLQNKVKNAFDGVATMFG
ncbi:MAG: pilin protein [Selenomonadaceae bacterium]|nr:pilin protein [Selenomonadaceae bacterium]MDY2685927.1 pilin protein [Selenomonadaceae bacterium]